MVERDEASREIRNSKPIAHVEEADCELGVIFDSCSKVGLKIKYNKII